MRARTSFLVLGWLVACSPSSRRIVGTRWQQDAAVAGAPSVEAGGGAGGSEQVPSPQQDAAALPSAGTGGVPQPTPGGAGQGGEGGSGGRAGASGARDAGTTPDVSLPPVDAGVPPPVTPPPVVVERCAVFDAYVQGSGYSYETDSIVDNDDVNFGGEALLLARHRVGVDQAFYFRQSFVAFDLAGITRVGRAVLTLSARTTDPENASRLQIAMVDQAWSEGRVTFGNRPPLGSPIATADVPIGDKAGVVIDVTDAVARAVAAGGATLSVGIEQDHAFADVGNGRIEIDARESGGTCPKLRVEP